MFIGLTPGRLRRVWPGWRMTCENSGLGRNPSVYLQSKAMALQSVDELLTMGESGKFAERIGRIGRIGRIEANQENQITLYCESSESSENITNIQICIHLICQIRANIYSCTCTIHLDSSDLL